MFCANAIGYGSTDHVSFDLSVIRAPLNVGFFSNFQSVVYLNAQVAYGGLQPMS
jgi:hypothetical protein